jgi:Ger(x)C family germination protein
MKRLLLVPLVSLLLTILPGCWDRMDLENVSFITVLGLDLDQENNLMVYSVVPSFSKEAKTKEDVVGVKAISLRDSRGKIDGVFEGIATGRKLQIILLGKRLLKHEDWFSLLDVFYRDTKNAVNAVAVYVDGPVSQVIYSKEKPRLDLYLSQMIKTTNERNETVKTTMQELHRQMLEKGITPAISELNLGKKLELRGVALLNEKGKYAASLQKIEEDALLRILQNQIGKELSLTIRLPQMKKRGEGIFEKNVISFNVNDIKNKIKTAYRHGRFQFDIRITSYITLTEREFRFDVARDGGKLEKMIDEQLEREFGKLIKKIQKNKIDPIGLGLHARAYEYKKWQKVQDDWGEALSKADIKINVNVKVKSMGPIK